MIKPDNQNLLQNFGQAKNDANQNALANPAEQKHFTHTEVRGRFNQYTSGYWALALPALAARYIGRYFTKLAKIDVKSPRAYATAAGSWMVGITTLYASRTYADMKRVFAETLAYEFDKKPEDVGLGDFFKSKNAIVHRTLTNFLKYNARRYAVSSSFFASFLPGPFKNLEADSVDLGVGVTGAYLFADVLNRKVTFFEGLQNFIDTKINHSENVGQVITDSDLLNLYAIHARDNDPHHPVSSRMDTPAWKQEQIIFGRMADLMNQTYSNTPNTEKADFTVPKLVYLLGNGLIKTDHIEDSLNYIEVANRFGMDAVKNVVKDVNAGMAPSQAFARYAVPTAEVIQAQQAGDKLASAHVLRLNEQKQKEALQTEYRFV